MLEFLTVASTVTAVVPLLANLIPIIASSLSAAALISVADVPMLVFKTLSKSCAIISSFYYYFHYKAIAIATANPALALLEFASTKVTTLDKAAFLLVPPAPSSTTIKSDVAKSAPISVPPSISIAAKGKLPVSPVPISVPVYVGKVKTAELPAECAGPFN